MDRARARADLFICVPMLLLFGAGAVTGAINGQSLGVVYGFMTGATLMLVARLAVIASGGEEAPEPAQAPSEAS